MLCECGCGKVTKKHHNKNKFSRFIMGHQHYNKVGNRRNHNIDLWLKSIELKPCKCGCGEIVKVFRRHYYRGIPQYIHGHSNTSPEFRAARREYNQVHTGELSSRWVKDRSKVRHWRKNFLISQKREIYVRDSGECQSCSAFTLFGVHKYDPLKANFDHIIPVKDGGTTEVSNGQTLCYICHKLKHSAKANRMNSGNARTVNPEPSSQSEKVQRLLEHSDMLNNQISVRHESDDIVQSR